MSPSPKFNKLRLLNFRLATKRSTWATCGIDA